MRETTSIREQGTNPMPFFPMMILLRRWKKKITQGAQEGAENSGDPV